MCGHEENNGVSQQTSFSSPCLEAELANKLSTLVIDTHNF